MPSFRKISGIGAALTAAQVTAQEKEAPPKKLVVDPKVKKLLKDDEIDLPIPEGQPQNGVKIPIYDLNGKLRMRFEIGTATRLDDDNVKLEKLRVEMFKEDESLEYDMDLPDAMYNRKTADLTSKVNVTVKRTDFEITGNSMTFNIKTRAGTLGGGVKMIIYGDTPPPKDKKPSVELKPIKEEKK